VKKIKEIINFYRCISRKRLILTLIGGLILSFPIIINIYTPVIIGEIINNLSNQVLNIKNIYFLIGLYILNIILDYVGNKIYLYNKYKAADEMRNYIFEKTFSIPIKEFNRNGAAYYSTLIREQLNNAFAVLDYSFIQNILLTVRMIFIMGIVFLWSKIIFIVFLLNGVAVYLFSKNMNKLTRPYIEKGMNEVRKINSFLNESFNNIIQVLSGNFVKKLSREYQEKNKITTDYFLKSEYIRVKLNILLSEIPEAFTKVFIIVYSAYLVLKGNMQIGQIWVLLTYYSYVKQPFEFFQYFSRAFLEGDVTINEINKFYSKTKENKGKDKKYMELLSEDNFYTLKNVNYKINGRKILKNINIVFPKNKIIGIVGLSGEGKSTLINILLGFEKAYEGEIYLNRKDIRNLTHEEIFNELDYYEQNVKIFNKSLKENIILGREWNKKRYEEIVEKLKLRHLENRKLGSNGEFISGGEKHRVQLARIMYSNKKYVILDEPLTNLDAINEKELLDILNEHLKDKSAIIISHKFNIIDICDLIAVIENSKITSFDAHENLLKKNDLYKKLRDIVFNFENQSKINQ